MNLPIIWMLKTLLGLLNLPEEVGPRLKTIMQGGVPHAVLNADAHVAQKITHPRFHFFSGFVRERNRENFGGGGQALSDHIRHAENQNAGFPGARTRENQKGARESFYRIFLGRIEALCKGFKVGYGFNMIHFGSPYKDGVLTSIIADRRGA